MEQNTAIFNVITVTVVSHLMNIIPNFSKSLTSDPHSKIGQHCALTTYNSTNKNVRLFHKRPFSAGNARFLAFFAIS
jgi:hypothetical protein